MAPFSFPPAKAGIFLQTPEGTMSSGKADFVYRRVLLKLSGEALAMPVKGAVSKPSFVSLPTAEATSGHEPRTAPFLAGTLDFIAGQVSEALAGGVEIAMVIGGGNIFRGKDLTGGGMTRQAADTIGMLSTVMNAVAVADALRNRGVDARVMTHNRFERVAEHYDRDEAVRHMRSGRPVIFAGGLGMPYFTTDTAAAHRAVDIGCDILLKATKVDGVYTADPVADPAAKRYDTISYTEVLERGLKVMDLTAVTICRENSMPLLVFDLLSKDSVVTVLRGGNIGTIVGGDQNAQ